MNPALSAEGFKWEDDQRMRPGAQSPILLQEGLVLAHCRRLPGASSLGLPMAMKLKEVSRSQVIIRGSGFNQLWIKNQIGGRGRCCLS